MGKWPTLVSKLESWIQDKNVLNSKIWSKTKFNLDQPYLLTNIN